jgi:hypothetical protein
VAGDRLREQHAQEQHEEKQRQAVLAQEPHGVSVVRQPDGGESDEPRRDQDDVDDEHRSHRLLPYPRLRLGNRAHTSVQEGSRPSLHPVRRR